MLKQTLSHDCWIVNVMTYACICVVGMDYVPLIKEEVVYSPGASAVNNSMSCTVLTIINDSALENTEAMSAILTTDLTVVLIPSTNISATILILEDPYDCKKCIVTRVIKSA